MALRYAGSCLQQMASATVSFSRFLPEVELVYALLSGETNQPEDVKKTAKKDYPGCVFILSNQFSECLIAEALLKSFYTDGTIIRLDDSSQFLEQQNNKQDVWIYSDKPTQFKQTVRKHAEHIDWVLVESDTNIKAYHDVQQFLDEFDANKFQKLKNQSVMLDDEEM